VTIEDSTLDQFKPFLLGYCNCGCGGNINIHVKKVRKYITHHNLGKRDKCPTWNGGIKKHKKYKYKLAPDHPFATKDGYIFEHRLVMEQHLGRYLTKYEQIHHIDKNKGNNEISNLLLVDVKTHMTYHRKNMDGRKCIECKSLKTRNNKGWNVWYGNEIDGFICYNCYMRSYRKSNKK
jgi:hypothetical protein